MNVDHLRGARVMVLGCSGFLGSWLSLMLLRLGVEVTGTGRSPISASESGRSTGLAARKFRYERLDVGDRARVVDVIHEVCPDVIVHLASHALFETKAAGSHGGSDIVAGARNVISAAATARSRPAVVIASTAGVPAGRRDLYTEAKRAIELMVSKRETDTARVSIIRPGTVVGGGDFGPGRLVPGLVEGARETGFAVQSPGAVRPWQHIIDATRGFVLMTAAAASSDAFPAPVNLGPGANAHVSVGELAGRIWSGLSGHDRLRPDDATTGADDCITLDDAGAPLIGWEPTKTIDDAIDDCVRWYRTWIDGGDTRMQTDLLLEAADDCRGPAIR